MDSKELTGLLKKVLTSRQVAIRADALTNDEAAEAYVFCDELLGVLDERRKELRLDLLRRAEHEGSATEIGGSELMTAMGKVVREPRLPKLPDAQQMLALIKQKIEDRKSQPIDENEDPLKITSLFEQVKTLELSPGKMQYLIDTGVLSQQEVDAIRYAKRTFALVMKQDEAVERAIEEIHANVKGINPENRPKPVKRSSKDEDTKVKGASY